MRTLIGLHCPESDPEGLHREILRRDKIISTLIRQIEHGLYSGSDYGLLQNTFALEKQVRQRTEELRQSIDEMDTLIANVPIGIVVTRDHVILRHNHHFAKMFGLKESESVGKSARLLFRSDTEFEEAKKIVDPILCAAKTHTVDAFMRHKNGSDLWIHSIGYALVKNMPGITAIWILEDRTSIRNAEEALRQSHAELAAKTLDLARREEELRTVIENANDAYLRIDSEGIVLAWNRQAQKTFGWRAEETIGRPLAELIVAPEIMEQYLRNLHTLEWVGQRLDLPARHRDGSRLMVEVRISALDFGGKNVFSVFLHDISARKATEAQREYEARHDTLTGLPNRRELMDILNRAMAHTQRTKAPLAILFLDLDGFKEINDTYGHETGDHLLIALGERLREETRQTDTVARLAGDEFIIVIEYLDDLPGDSLPCANRILNSMASPFAIDQQLITVGISIGMVIYSGQTAKSAQELIQQADQAMYEAKKQGKGRIVMMNDTDQGIAPA